MANFTHERVLSVQHWTDSLFTIKATRSSGFRFDNGQFVMIGLEGENGARPLMRAYSMVSASHEEHLEFYSIKVPNGPLTSRLQHIKEGDTLLVGTKPTGTLVIGNLLPGRTLWLLSTGTGLAPFLSVIKDPETYERFERVVITHTCRSAADLTYESLICEELPGNEYFGDEVKAKLLYYPTVTREPFKNQGRITDLIRSGKVFEDLGLPPLSLADDRIMMCGSPDMLTDTCKILDELGFEMGNSGEQGHYLIERAFAPK
jgi:ferredoxin--NADP+ reductase